MLGGHFSEENAFVAGALCIGSAESIKSAFALLYNRRLCALDRERAEEMANIFIYHDPGKTKRSLILAADYICVVLQICALSVLGPKYNTVIINDLNGALHLCSELWKINDPARESAFIIAAQNALLA
jgi:hypothetical protein